MFKKLLISMLLFLASCNSYGNMKVTEDDFTDKKNVTINFLYFSGNSLYDGIFRTVFKFIKEIDSDNREKIYLKVYADAYNNADNMKSMAFLRVDNKKIKVNLLGMSTDITNLLNNGSNSHYNKKSLGILSWQTFRATMIVDKSLKEDILSCNDLSIRLYSGISPATFRIRNEDLYSIKRFLNHNGAIIDPGWNKESSFKPY